MINEPHNDDLADLLAALRDEDAAVRERAIRRLSLYANSARKHEKDDVLATAQAIGVSDRRKQRLQDGQIVGALLAAIEDTSAQVRAVAVFLLMRGNVTTAAAEEAFIRHLRDDPEKGVRMVCAAALRRPPSSASKVKGLIAALQDAHDLVVSPACVALGENGDPQTIEPLRDVLSHPSWDVRFYACEALVRLKAVDAAVVNVLEDLNRQSEAQEHNEIAQRMSESDHKHGERSEQTTHAVLDQAHRLLGS